MSRVVAGRLLLAGLLGCGLGSSVGCTGAAGPRIETVADLAWPPTAPRVRLETLIDLSRSLEGRTARRLRRLTGSSVPRTVQRPYGVAWDGERLLVTDPGTGRVIRLDLEGGATVSPPRAFASPIGVAACSGRVVVTDSRDGRVALVDDRLRPTVELATGLQRPTGIACTADGVVVAETGRHRLLRIPWAHPGAATPEGTPTPLGHRGAGAGELNFPVALAVAGTDLWVGDTLNFRLQRLDLRTGGFVGDFGRLGDAPGDLPRIKGVAVDRVGHVWVSDAVLDQVALYRPEGDLLLALGGPGQTPGLQLSLSRPASTEPRGTEVRHAPRAVQASLGRRSR